MAARERVERSDIAFWCHINGARIAVKQQQHDTLEHHLTALAALSQQQTTTKNRRYRPFLQQFLTTYRLKEQFESLLERQTDYRGTQVNPIVGGGIDNYVEQIGSGISVVSCTMNRHANLLKALRSWLACEAINEVVIVDWSSTEPLTQFLQQQQLHDERVKIVRVEGQSRWILSYAFNLGFRVASYDKIIKADADILIYPSFFTQQQLLPKSVIAGNWRKVASEQAHINGFFYIHRHDLLSINGFNEYLTRYGWDDNDIYQRLQQAGVVRYDVNPATLYHLPHRHAERLEPSQADDRFNRFRHSTQFAIRCNKYIAALMPCWGRQQMMLLFTITAQYDNELRVKQRGRSSHTVAPHIECDAEYYAMLEMLSWRGGEIAYQLQRHEAENLLHKFDYDTITISEIKRSVQGQPQSSSQVKSYSGGRLYIDAQHGLGNRLRAIASAAVIAQATDRELVIVWQPDHHCHCQFRDLFDYQGEVLEQSFIQTAQSRSMKLYNYMEIEPGAKKFAPIEPQVGQDLYIRSAYALKSELADADQENRYLQTLQPNYEVVQLIEPYGVSQSIGVHIRMEGGKGLDHLSYDAPENWSQKGHEQLHYWREKSHYRHFISRMDQIIEEQPEVKFFLATDREQTYQMMRQRYGERILFLPRSQFDRSKDQIIYALADAILLSRCRSLLGSTWSSFTELAMRLSIGYERVEMSGHDF
ncbi:glycosyltransferase [Ectothiorhodospiraceae bacterium BW-2]|nr:glycosyltransferase [Ectothiorhodospiraceae bacterium BW-2]